MKQQIIVLFLINTLWCQNKIPFTIDIRPRVIDDAKIIVVIDVTNHIGRPVDYLEGFISEFTSEKL